MRNAETVYLFRHALLRDAAYQLQLPGDRARLHRFAFELIEALAGGRPPEPPPLDAPEAPAFKAHGTDRFALELVRHARVALAAHGIEAAGEESASLASAAALYLRRAAEVTSRQFRHETAETCWLELAALQCGGVRAAALRLAGEAAHGRGCPFEAEKHFEGALNGFREVGDRVSEGVALGSLAGVYRETGRVEQAERTYEQALAIDREVGNRRIEGAALGNLAILYSETGRVAQSERTYEQALAIQREVGNRRFEGVVLGNLANVYRQTGRVKQAERAYGQALTIHREVGDRRSEGVALGNLTGVYHQTGRVEQAEQTYEKALAILREVGIRRSEGIALGNLAALYNDTGRIDLAERTFAVSLAIHREVGNRRFEGLHLCAFCEVFLALKKLDKARETWRQGATILRQLGDSQEIQSRTDRMRQACAKAGVLPFDEAPH